MICLCFRQTPDNLLWWWLQEMDMAEAAQPGEGNNHDILDDVDAELQALAEVTPMVSAQVMMLSLLLSIVIVVL